MSRHPFRVKAIYEYSSPHDDDLSFTNGQVITVTDEEEADWYSGEYIDVSGKKQEGLFPRNFVEPYEPETPPRPSRLSRSKKDLEHASMESKEEDLSARHVAPAENTTTLPLRTEDTTDTTEGETNHVPTIPPSTKPTNLPSSAPSLNTATKPTSSDPAKLVSASTEKPLSGSFRDRINAFNKPAAVPITPAKPIGLGSSGGSSFVKKPFVAPPPSKNAFVPPPRDSLPQKVSSREEDPDLVAQIPKAAEGQTPAGPSQPTASVENDDDLPKPTSLKDRIALLQKQQIEQTARHAEAAKKKEKPKRPPKKRLGSQERITDSADFAEGENLDRANTGDSFGKGSVPVQQEEEVPEVPSSTRPYKSKDITPLASPTRGLKRDLSDGNEADQSGAGDTEDGEEMSISRDDSDENPKNKGVGTTRKMLRPGHAEDDVEDNLQGEQHENEEDEEQEEEIDPELKKRMEIRDRMAKVSGGMGMAGMFGPMGGMPVVSSKRQGSTSNKSKIPAGPEVAATDSSISRASSMPVAPMPMPGMQKRQTAGDDISEISKDEDSLLHSVVKGRNSMETSNAESPVQELLPTSRRSTDIQVSASVPEDRNVPVPQSDTPVASTSNFNRAAPQRVDSQPVPNPPPVPPVLPDEGSDSDNELPRRHITQSLKKLDDDDGLLAGREPPPIPSNRPPPIISNEPHGSPVANRNHRASMGPHIISPETPPMSPTSPGAHVASPGRIPPIPGSGSVVPAAPQAKAPPPPPPPPGIKPSRASTEELGLLSSPRNIQSHSDTDEEITEYEGDYDTDIAPITTRKESLKSHARGTSIEDDSFIQDAQTYWSETHQSEFPSLGSQISTMPRAIPPPPPTQPPRKQRQSSEMPRAPPPPPPSKEQTYDAAFDESYPHGYSKARSQILMGPGGDDLEGSLNPIENDFNDLQSKSSLQQMSISGSTIQTKPPTTQQIGPITTSLGQSSTIPRKSLEVQRTSGSLRRSTEGSRPSSDQLYIATDIDLGHESGWWSQQGLIPPVLQDRLDLIHEMEETSTVRRGGKQAISKSLYVLYMDYSQTIISARFEMQDPAAVKLEQRHEPPPSRLRQEQLEQAHAKFGRAIEEGAVARKEAVVGDGSPHALVSEVISSLPDALPPVGTRAYGAIIYANLANASVMQLDEIRSGDIVTFRNTKFQGHRGPMKSKYNIEVGKPDHVGIVVDWDGTRKKIRAWEQGRDSKKVRIESFKLGDMRSGEVKVWRTMARDWIGWESQN